MLEKEKYKTFHILYFIKLYGRVSICTELVYLLKLFVFEKDNYFWKKCVVIFTCDFSSLNTVRNLCPNL